LECPFPDTQKMEGGKWVWKPGIAVATAPAKAAVVQQQPARTVACIHLGVETGEQIDCPECRGTVRVKIFACPLHTSCAIAKALPGHACCTTCPDYAPA
jgi:hypothetical protein